MVLECVEWVKQGGSLPDVPELLAAMTQTTYTHKGDRLLIEPKEQVKAKLGYSPDHFDALMLTFAAPVVRKVTDPWAAARRRVQEAEYNPFREAYDVVRTAQRLSWWPRAIR